MSEITQNRKKAPFLIRQRNTIVALAIVFAILVAGYFIIVAPILKDEPTTQGTIEPVKLLPGEFSISNKIFMFKSLERSEIKEVKIHNPRNSEQYVDWGFTVKIEKTTADDGTTTTAPVMYLSGYEYAPLDQTIEAYLVTGTGYPIVTSRVEEHCTDFEKYGLEYSDGSNDDKATYYIIESVSGETHKVYIGDKIPSGSGYYARCVDTVTDDSGKTYVRDSVYIVSSSTIEASVLSSPPATVTPLITYPLSFSTTSSAYFNAFAVQDTDGSLDIQLVPVKKIKDDPFASFAALSSYEAANIEGFYGSTDFESLNETFSNFSGVNVVELAVLKTFTDDKTGEEYEEYFFEDEVFEKYGLTNPRYYLFYNYLGVDSIAYFSDVQDDGYQYAYSLVFNTIVRVSPETLYFLEWETYQYIQSEVFQMDIKECQSVTVKGKYDGKDVNESFTLSEIPVRNDKGEIELGSDGKPKTELIVNSLSNSRVLNTDNFRYYYQVLIQVNIHDKVPSDIDIEKLKEEGEYASFTIKTNEKTVFKLDSAGNETNKYDYTVPSVTRIYRFYRYSNGHLLCTVESIDANGESSGEIGSFYALTSRLDKLLSDTLKVKDDIEVDKRERG